MVSIRSTNEIILSLIDFYRSAQPDADTKEGTVIRDLMIEGPASQLSLLYDELAGVSNQQSMRLVIGSDLDKLAKNFGIIRKQSTPATGVALLTFSSINAAINVNKGDSVIANNGFSYAASNGISVSPASINYYRSVASKFRDQLDFAGISDQYAVEITVIATTAGSAGNIAAYSLSRTAISGVSNTTNINSFNGGNDQENDASFRNRVLSSFSGSSVGTSLGYLNVALSTTGVSDATVIEPGDPLMTRDGTIVSIAADGTRTIISEGTGGKVDVVVLGSNLVETSDSFIYRDKSNNNNPASSKNDVVLGQLLADVGKTINRKRIDDIATGTLPSQPVDTLLQITGSISGSNFIEKSIDSYDRVSGNYELIKDIGVYGGSPFGFDTFHWISNKISGFSEDKIKGQVNGQDTTTFTDVLSISNAQQNLSITNENSKITTDKSIIQLLHTPATNITRVFNVNTGERYIISDQNLDQTGIFNTTGRIKISGNTLPSTSDVLQVDYSWIVNYDQYSDFDGLSDTINPRSVSDSIDWGYASIVNDEKIIFNLNVGNNFFQGISSQPIATIITADKFSEVDGYVIQVSTGTFVNRFAIVIDQLPNITTTIESVKLKNCNVELYDTAEKNSVFSNMTQIIGTDIYYITTIILPSDTVAVIGDKVSVIFNSLNVFNSDINGGSSNGNQITIPSSLIDTDATNITLRVSYISAVSDLMSTATTSLPASRNGNGFNLLNNNGFTNFSITNMSRRENQTVQKNLSNQYYIELNLLAVNFTLDISQIISVIRLSDNLELWNSSNVGSIITGTSGNYQLIFNGVNSPAINDKVLIIYYTTDIKNFQPFSYSNNLINSRINTLQINDVNTFKLNLNSFTNQASGLHYTIIEPNTNIILYTVSDGYLSTMDSFAQISSLTVNFSETVNITQKKVIIINATAPNNNGTYDIIGYDLLSNKLQITSTLDNILPEQISVIRILDGQELWNYSGTIDVPNNKITFQQTPTTHVNDGVFIMYFNYNNLRRAPTRIIGNITDQVSNTGVMTINGTSLSIAKDIVFTATNTGLKLNLSEALRKSLNINSATNVPNGYKIAKIIKAEKVITASSTDDTVLTVSAIYDTKNTIIQNNLFYTDTMISDLSLQNLDFILPNTQNNTLDVETHNIPKIGDKIRITFYYILDNDSENLSYTRNGLLYTNKKFALINKIYVSSGFKSSQSTKFTATSFTQPSLGARYTMFYDYTAPKQNERIVVRYNYNKLIGDATFNIENSRPINADVLARESKLVELDLTINVVIDPNYLSSTTTVLQNLKDKLTTALTTTILGGIVDSPTLINVAQAIAGISRARILYFNKVGGIGQVLKVQAQKDEYFAPNNIIINTETR